MLAAGDRYLPQELIRKKRDGKELERDEIDWLARGIADGTLADAQVGALAMAMLLKGLTVAETAALTLGMRDSGRTLAWPDLPGPVLDKHSTGGVGDKISLILAPLVAACGGYVPMLSGRGLGHTGGTLDKLESIPGYNAKPDLDRFRETVRKVGCAIIGQTNDLAPADRRLYAIRDVAGAVESVPLITASILSKKLAAGLDGLVMDVKVGSGAFLPALAAARQLARSIVDVAGDAGLTCRALITDMNQCLGHTAGNALEVAEAIAFLRSEDRRPRVYEVVKSLATEMLMTGRLAGSERAAGASVDRALASGAAAERFAAMIAALGGPTDIVDRPQHHLSMAPLRIPVRPEQAGFIEGVDARALGMIVVALGGGRTRPDQQVDPAVGLAEVAEIGDEVGERPLATVHARDAATAAAAAAALRRAFVLADRPAIAGRVIVERVQPG